MTDIVERLETFGDVHSWAVRGDAADEIKRLRAALHKIASTYPCSTVATMSRVASDALGITYEQAKDKNDARD